MQNRVLYMVMALATLFLVACGDTDDISFPDDGKKDPQDPLQAAVVTQLQAHTEGKGFPVVIMGDGYTQRDIDFGVYHAAAQKAVDAMFCMEPMASLRQYFDVYEITAASKHSGIDYEKHETVFSTNLQGDDTTNIWGDSVTVQQYAFKALDYNTAQLQRALIIVLLNCDKYAGVTLLAMDKDVQDSIPSGLSLAYIPAKVTYEGTDFFPLLVQHEAVGHGIGKLADEYYYENESAEKDIKTFKDGYKHGFYMNTHYHPEAEGTHQVEGNSFFYPLTQDSRYDLEALQWYQGAFTFPKGFYRPTSQSIMNETVNAGGERFNAPSRLMIYKRVMREAFGKEWTCDLSQTEHLEAFTEFDALGRWSYAYPAKGLAGKPLSTAGGGKRPHHTAPRILNISPVQHN